jgi:hydroxymethylglutaryl-CoA lyase
MAFNIHFMNKDTTVILEEQGLRDGLQSLNKPVPTEMKIQIIEQLVDAGLKRLQVVSFVHPRLVPQMADAEVIIKSLPKRDDIVFSGLALNLKGVERAAQTGLRHLAISLSASNTHSLKNTNMTIAEAKISFGEMVELAKQHNIIVRGGIQCAFGCRYEGHISEKTVLQLVENHLKTGVNELALADSTGMGNPLSMKRLLRSIMRLVGDTPVALHLHNTENKGLANVYAALEVGIRQFDTAFGGLGGCPFIQSASGNIATEDTAHLLHQMGFKTGIDIAKVSTISRTFEAFVEYELQGQMYKLWDKEGIAII